MDVIPRISTPREDARTPSGDEHRAWKGTYEAYLQSPQWHRIRNAALRRAHYRCQRCPAQRPLQVHHTTYERLGNERDEDLEVLCFRCHEGYHIDEEHQVRGIYVKVVSECLRAERFTSMAELLAAVKDACGRNKIPYDGNKVWKAVRLVDANRKGVLDAPKPIHRKTWADLPDDVLYRPLTKEEARVLYLEFRGVVKTMANISFKDSYLDDMARANDIRQQAAEMLK